MWVDDALHLTLQGHIQGQKGNKNGKKYYFYI